MSLSRNIASWLSGGTRSRELRDTREAWEEVERMWRVSALASDAVTKEVVGTVFEACDHIGRMPARPIVLSLCSATDDVLHLENVSPLEAKWDVINSDILAALEFREMMARRRRWVSDFPRLMSVARRQFVAGYRSLVSALPESCFSASDDQVPMLEVPLIELLEDPAQVIQDLTLFPYDDETLRLDMFLRFRRHLEQNMVVASGFPPETNPVEVQSRLIVPTRHKCRNARELAELYLGGTPYASLLEMPIPFSIPDGARFEHCHIVGGTGHGKTQLMQRMIHADLMIAVKERRSIVVIDSQGDLINKLMRLDLFDPEAASNLSEQLIVIDPADVEFPAALNLFDAHLSRLKDYRAVDRERVLNGVIELYEIFFGAMLGAELTQKQGVVFRYLARLMITIPAATIHTLMQLMENGRHYQPYMDQLDGSARHFFRTEFFHPSFSATKKQILKRLWGVLSTPAFERMFAQRHNKLDLFQAMNEGKIILISTAKDLLKTEGSQLFGRFFIAMLAQATLERSTIDPEERTPTFVYVDEAQEYFDDSIETILNQARKYRVGLTLAHQTLDQLSPRLRSAILSNTSIKCAGGVSARDARALGDELRTTSDFIESMRRRGDRSEFAVWVKQQTHQAIRVSIPLGFLEQQPLLSEEAFASVVAANRISDGGTLADVMDLDPLEPDAPTTPAAGSAPPKSSPKTAAGQSVKEPVAEISVPDEDPKARIDRSKLPRPPVASRELGKGGSQHRYIQHLVKGLAEERGFRAIIEGPTDGGQIDVVLHRDLLTIACEISATSTPDHEIKNLEKCLRGGFRRIFAIATDAKRLRALEKLARTELSEASLEQIYFLTPETVAAALDSLAVSEPEERVVRGYRVKVTRRPLGSSDIQDKQETIARVIAQSMRDLSKTD